MSDPQHLDLGELGQRVQAMGSEAGSRPAAAREGYEEVRVVPAPRPSSPPAQAPSVAPANTKPSGLQRAIGVVRSTIPVVQRLLPILDGNIATAVGALLAPHAHPAPQTQVQPVQVNLEPIERSLAEVRDSHRELRSQVQEHVTALKRVEDHLEQVREATDRNTLEQEELFENLRSTGNRIRTFAILGALLLAVSLGLNIYLLMQFQHIFR
jgi:hypothetical protein